MSIAWVSILAVFAAAPPCPTAEQPWSCEFPNGQLAGGGFVHAFLQATPSFVGEDSLFAAGNFEFAAGLPANGVARFDGARWWPLGGGMAAAPDGDTASTSYTVSSLALFDDGTGEALYAGGNFDFADGAPAGNIARWDGTEWSPVGTGLEKRATGLTVFDDGTGPALVAGSTVEVEEGGWSPLAEWDGTSWKPLGAMESESVLYAFGQVTDADGPAIYVGGANFVLADSAEPTRLAKWDGSTWSAVGPPLDSVPTAIIQSPFTPNAVIVGGYFEHAGEQPLPYIGEWDGTTWTPLGGGTNDAIPELVAFDDGSGPAVFASTSAGAVLRYDGRTWEVLAPHNGVVKVFSLGAYTAPGAISPALLLSKKDIDACIDQLQRWDGTSWTVLGDGVVGCGSWGGAVDAMEVFNEALYIGGSFAFAGTEPAPGMARWNPDGGLVPIDGLLPLGTVASVAALETFDDGSGTALYAGGALGVTRQSSAGVARWDGEHWTEVGGGVSSPGWVNALAAFSGPDGPVLCVGGEFTLAGSTEVSNIAAWDGSSWSALGAGVDDDILTLAVFDDGNENCLYAGGLFDTAGGISSPGIARWNGVAWSSVGEGLGDESTRIAALAVHDDGSGPALYAGGSQWVDGTFSAVVARWDGASWSSLPVLKPQLPATCFETFHAPDGRGTWLYMGRLLVDGVADPYGSVAAWDGATWHSVGAELSHRAPGTCCSGPFVLHGLASGDQPSLFVGGRFEFAGGISSLNIARWSPFAPPIGDLDGDGAVTAADLALLVAAWGPCPLGASCPADLDGDGLVDGADLGIMLGNWTPSG